MKTNIFLLGDSVLNNSNYVPYGSSVCNYLHNNNNNNNSFNHYCLAENNSTINNVYNQFSRVDISFNKETTIFYISVGGNDIINFYDIKKNNLNEIEIIFGVYKKLIESIKTRFPFIKIGLLNIYYPLSNQYQLYWGAIKKWNELLNNQYGYLVSNHINNNNNNIEIIDITKIMNSLADFTHNIEPSIIGGEKIAKLLLNQK
jgi:hypothetical protein